VHFAATARPDAVAVCIAGVAFLRGVRRGTFGVLDGALFALAAWTKPNVFGMAGGALLVFVLARPRDAWRPIVGALVVSVGIAGVLSALTGRVWLDHLLRSTGQPFAVRLWRNQMEGRIPFFGLPLAYVAWSAWPRRAEIGVRLGIAGLATSVAWTLLSLGKIGAASVYWMEPCAAAAIVFSQVGPRFPATPRYVFPFAVGVAVQAFWTDVGSIESGLEELTLARRHADLLARARAACGVGPNAFVASDQPGPEVVLDGRIMTTPFQMTHLVRRGKFPAQLWVDALADVPCVVVEGDVLERPASDYDDVWDRIPVAVRLTMARGAREVDRAGEWRVYARPPGPTSLEETVAGPVGAKSTRMLH
jgi:hypothetical protein